MRRHTSRAPHAVPQRKLNRLLRRRGLTRLILPEEEPEWSEGMISPQQHATAFWLQSAGLSQYWPVLYAAGHIELRDVVQLTADQVPHSTLAHNIHPTPLTVCSAVRCSSRRSG